MKKLPLPVRMDAVTSVLICENGHVFTTAMVATFAGSPCPDCGTTLARRPHNGP